MITRNNLKLFLMLLAIVAYSGCNTEDKADALGGDVDITETLPSGSFNAEVSNVTVTPGSQTLTVAWTPPVEKGELGYYQVSWIGNLADPALHTTIVANDNQSVVLSHLFNDTYTVTVQCVSNDLLFSTGVSATGTPTADVTPPGQVTNLVIEPLATAATAIWTNPTDKDFERIKLNVYDVTNGVTILNTDLSTLVTQFQITGLADTTEYEVSMTTVDYIGNTSSAVAKDIKTLTEKFLDKTKWKMLSYTSQEEGGEGATGRAADAIDSNDKTFWHSKWYSGPGTSGLPQYILFDLNQEVVPTLLVSYKRDGNPNGPTSVKIEGSLDQVTWYDFGTHALKANVNEGQNCYLTNPKKIRYVRYTVLAAGSNNAMVREISIKALVSN